MAQQEEDRIFIDFIDPLFAVVLSVSFAQILDEAWFKNFGLIFSREYGFEVATLLLLAYGTVVLSWVGYHQSIKTAPIKATGKWGFWRFIFDVFLLIAYFILLVSFCNFRRVLWTLVAIFVLYVAWDDFKRREYRQSDYPERRAVTLLWCIVFFGIAGLYTLLPFLQEVRYLILVLAALAIYFYRRHKNWYKEIAGVKRKESLRLRKLLRFFLLPT